MKASSVSFQAAVLFALLGMIWGIGMAISENHSAMPAHAHLNLLGWVSLFLFGVFYQLHPAIDRGRLALIQVSIWITGTVILTVGVGLIYSGHPIGDPLAGIGAFILLGGMLLFGWLVVRRDTAAALPLHSAVPAE
jgi:peptidoglycan/LPS O-acetylase OafA/YrhL